MILGTLFHWSSIIPCVDIVIIPIVQKRKLRLKSHHWNVVKPAFESDLVWLQGHNLMHTLHYYTQRNNSRFWKRRYPKNTFLRNNVQSITGSEPENAPAQQVQCLLWVEWTWLTCEPTGQSCSPSTQNSDSFVALTALGAALDTENIHRAP